jgi:hypothetical protein
MLITSITQCVYILDIDLHNQAATQCLHSLK